MDLVPYLVWGLAVGAFIIPADLSYELYGNLLALRAVAPLFLLRSVHTLLLSIPILAIAATVKANLFPSADLGALCECIDSRKCSWGQILRSAAAYERVCAEQTPFECLLFHFGRLLGKCLRVRHVRVPFDDFVFEALVHTNLEGGCCMGGSHP